MAEAQAKDAGGAENTATNITADEHNIATDAEAMDADEKHEEEKMVVRKAARAYF